jgi:hypothetical protein
MPLFKLSFGAFGLEAAGAAASLDLGSKLSMTDDGPSVVISGANFTGTTAGTARTLTAAINGISVEEAYEQMKSRIPAARLGRPCRRR